MNTNLIPGGVYTANNYCYVFIKEYPETNRLLFFRIKPEKYNLKSIQREIKVLFVSLSVRTLNTRFAKFVTNDFLQKYNGYIGCIEPWLMDKIEKLWRDVNE